MALTIEALSNNQAQHAIMYLYQELPLRLWPMAKPSFHELKNIKSKFSDPRSVSNLIELNKIFDQDYPTCGLWSKRILFHLECMEDYAPFIEGAVHYSTQPRMSPAPSISVQMLTCALSLMTVVNNDPLSPSDVSYDSELIYTKINQGLASIDMH